MTETARRSLIFTSQQTSDPTIGSWLAALGDARRRTLETVAGLDPATIDWVPPAGGNRIGGLLYHIALIEADWLSAEVREEPTYPADLLALFPWPARDEAGRLTTVTGLALDTHLARLDAVRAQTVATLATMTVAEFRRIRALPAYDVTPEWVAHHLLQHEAEHRGEIGVTLGLTRAAGLSSG
jgi:uncharacterized damage-inducible protein DinB